MFGISARPGPNFKSDRLEDLPMPPCEMLDSMVKFPESVCLGETKNFVYNCTLGTNKLAPFVAWSDGLLEQAFGEDKLKWLKQVEFLDEEARIGKHKNMHGQDFRLFAVTYGDNIDWQTACCIQNELNNVFGFLLAATQQSPRYVYLLMCKYLSPAIVTGVAAWKMRKTTATKKKLEEMMSLKDLSILRMQQETQYLRDCNSRINENVKALETELSCMKKPAINISSLNGPCWDLSKMKAALRALSGEGCKDQSNAGNHRSQQWELSFCINGNAASTPIKAHENPICAKIHKEDSARNERALEIKPKMVGVSQEARTQTKGEPSKCKGRKEAPTVKVTMHESSDDDFAEPCSKKQCLRSKKSTGTKALAYTPPKKQSESVVFDDKVFLNDSGNAWIEPPLGEVLTGPEIMKTIKIPTTDFIDTNAAYLASGLRPEDLERAFREIMVRRKNMTLGPYLSYAIGELVQDKKYKQMKFFRGEWFNEYKKKWEPCKPSLNQDIMSAWMRVSMDTWREGKNKNSGFGLRNWEKLLVNYLWDLPGMRQRVV